MATALVVVGLVQLLAASSFTYVARVLGARVGTGEGAGAQRAFVAWWVGMAGVVGMRGVLYLLAATGWTSLAATEGERYVEIVCIAFAAWGMTYYVAFLYSGRTWLAPLLGAYFGLVGLFYAWATYTGNPSQVLVGPWTVALSPPTPWIDTIYVLVGAPILLATLAYLSLIGRDIRPMQRYRIGLVGVSILAWVAGGLAASLEGDALLGLFAITGLGIVTAGAVFIAYRPPLWALRRWDPEAAKADPRGRSKNERAAERRARMIHLI